MPLLYLFETTFEHRGVASKELYKLWLNHTGPDFKLQEKGLIKYSFKVAGEKTVVGVMSVESPGVLDTCFAQLPLYQVLGDQIHTRFTPLRSYEGFATDLSERAGSDTKFEEEKEKKELKQGLFYIVTSSVEFDPALMTQQDFLKAWAEEAKAAVGAKKLGTLLDLWKVVAEKKVISLFCVQDPAELDRMSLDLPIAKKTGIIVRQECKSIRPIGEWAEDLKKLAE
ncbi:unnamed protein product [Porites lobata]|uniref:Muconolactone isomerase domain-containing protein n=1 Tax=Porites lobata TaxID=104759 RepID=A0ABN8NJT7_9CNID|nr:unnamed protein product [Porites lobata]